MGKSVASTIGERRRVVAWASACILSAAFSPATAPKANAAVIDTYDFTQGGYIMPGDVGSGVLNGSFAGTVEASGFIELADLSSINVAFTFSLLDGPMTLSASGPASFFSFDTAGGSSTLDFVTVVGFGPGCVGAAAAFGLGGCGPGSVNGFVAQWVTGNVPLVTLVSSVAVVPEPSTWAMTLLGFAGYRRARRLA